LIGSSIILKTLFSLIIALPNPIQACYRGSTEILLFHIAGIDCRVCEEIICRGYLQIQFHRSDQKFSWRGADSRPISVVHAYQGHKFMLVIAVMANCWASLHIGGIVSGHDGSYARRAGGLACQVLTDLIPLNLRLVESQQHRTRVSDAHTVAH
jgi:hypothetical protein